MLIGYIKCLIDTYKTEIKLYEENAPRHPGIQTLKGVVANLENLLAYAEGQEKPKGIDIQVIRSHKISKEIEIDLIKALKNLDKNGPNIGC